jgi:hypothetical protein
LIIYGGVNGENYLGDAWYFNLKNSSYVISFAISI